MSKINDFNYTETNETFMSKTLIDFVDSSTFGSLLNILSGDFFKSLYVLQSLTLW